MTFEGQPGRFENISYDRFVGIVSANFDTGIAALDIFKLGPGGRVDGKPILALLPPGQGST